MKDVKVKKR